MAPLPLLSAQDVPLLFQFRPSDFAQAFGPYVLLAAAIIGAAIIAAAFILRKSRDNRP